MSATKISRWFYTIFIKPTGRDEDYRRQEFILNVILSFCLVGLLTLDGSVLYYSLTDPNYHGVSLGLFSLIVLGFAGLLVLSRLGKSRWASHGVIVAFILAATYASWTWGANLQQALLGFVLVIAISSILIGTLYSFIVAGIVSLITVIIWNLQLAAIIKPHWYWYYELKPHHAVDFVVLFFIITAVLWLSNREIEKSLHRARQSEYELRLERDSLEERVIERTAELKNLELERISDLYRFAEFGKLSSGIFHDLVNPLTAVSVSIESLRAEQSDTGDYAAVEERISRAITATKRMDRLIKAVSKQIKTQEHIALFSPSKEIDEVLTILHHKARIAGVDITKDIDSRMMLFGNPLRFYQVVNNIVSNSIDACEENPPTLPRQCHISLKKSNTAAALIISNTGPDIPAHILPLIFEPFFTTKPSDRGTGIGLSMSKNIVEKEFAGTITVTSSHGITTFDIALSLHNS